MNRETKNLEWITGFSPSWVTIASHFLSASVSSYVKISSPFYSSSCTVCVPLGVSTVYHVRTRTIFLIHLYDQPLAKQMVLKPPDFY